MRNIFYQITFISNANPLWITLLALLFTAASCKKEEEPRHRDVFRCEINGVPWEAECESTNLVFGCSAIDCQYYKNTGYLSLGGQNKLTDDGISIVKFNNLQIGSNIISVGTYGIAFEGKSYNITNEGIIHIINIDLINKFIEGNFEFIAIDWVAGSRDSVLISNGYFKVKYRP